MLYWSCYAECEGEEEEEVVPPNVIYSLADDTGPIRVKNELNPYLKATYGLVWESGDPLVKEFPITIVNDQKLEDNETVLLKLEEPFLLRRWAMTTNDFDALMLELISNSADEVDPYWVQNQAIAPGGGDGGDGGGGVGAGGDCGETGAYARQKLKSSFGES